MAKLRVHVDTDFSENLAQAQEKCEEVSFLRDHLIFLPLIEVLRQKKISTGHLIREAAPSAKEAIEKAGGSIK